jgi:hypothetical protein
MVKSNTTVMLIKKDVKGNGNMSKEIIEIYKDSMYTIANFQFVSILFFTH